MNKELHDLFYVLPSGTDYAVDLTDLSVEDIPRERIPKLKALLKGEDQYFAYKAACILCSWAEEDGFEYLRQFVCDHEPADWGWIPHRLRGYDETYRFVVSALIRYWAKRADAGEGDEAQRKMFAPMSRLIEFSNTMPFDIDSLLRWMEDGEFPEYLPAIKIHLQAILDHPERHHWKIADCAHFLMKFDPDFVTAALTRHGKTLSDFPRGY